MIPKLIFCSKSISCHRHHRSHLALSALFNIETVYPINDHLCQISALCESYGYPEPETAGAAPHSYITEAEKLEHCAIDWQSLQGYKSEPVTYKKHYFHLCNSLPT